MRSISTSSASRRSRRCKPPPPRCSPGPPGPPQDLGAVLRAWEQHHDHRACYTALGDRLVRACVPRSRGEAIVEIWPLYTRHLGMYAVACGTGIRHDQRECHTARCPSPSENPAFPARRRPNRPAAARALSRLALFGDKGAKSSPLRAGHRARGLGRHVYVSFRCLPRRR